jgi:hypothetical protein
MFCSLKKHRKAIEANTEALLTLAKAVRYLAGPPSGIGNLSIEIIGDNGKMLVTRVLLPAVPAATPEGEVVSGLLTLTVNGVDQTHETVVGQQVIEGLEFNDGDKVAGKFEFIDNSGNPSPNPKTFDEVELKDTIGVDPEGEFGIQVTSEV